MLKIEDFQIFGHMLIWDAHFFTSFLCNSCNFQYFILGWPTLVLGPSIITLSRCYFKRAMCDFKKESSESTFF